MTVKDLMAATGAKNSRAALARAIRREPGGEAALKAEGDAAIRSMRIHRDPASTEEQRRMARQGLAIARARRREIENIVRAKWGMPPAKD